MVNGCGGGCVDDECVRRVDHQMGEHHTMSHRRESNSGLVETNEEFFLGPHSAMLQVSF